MYGDSPRSSRLFKGLSRVRTGLLLAVVALLIALAAGLLVDQSWLYIAFIGFFILMHMFGHGSHGHGSSHDEAHSKEEGKEEDHTSHGGC